MRALILTGRLATDQEVFYPLYRMEEEGWKVDIAVRGGKETVGEKGIKIVPTMDIPTFHGPADSPNVLILPGGAKAMEYMRQDKDIITYIKYYHATGGVIGSICHGAQLLISAGLVKGRDILGYYSIKDDIINAGGRFPLSTVVSDNRIITASHYKDSGLWMKEVIKDVYYYAKSV